jgi:hydrogenase maturation protease
VPDTLIQCIGNRLRRDDGAGPYIADLLKQAGLADDIEIQEHWGEGSELMQYWDSAAKVVLIDSACSGGAPGSRHTFDAIKQEIPRDFCYYTSHRFGVAEAVEVARALGQLPPSLQLYAIEGADFSQGEGLSDAVRAAARQLAEELRLQLGKGRPTAAE